MIRFAPVMLALLASTAAGTVQAQEQRDVVIQVRVGADDASEWAGWESGEYGELLSGRLPGSFFTDGEPRAPSLIRQSQSDLTTLSIGFVSGALHPATYTDPNGDGVYDHYTLRIKDAGGVVLWQANLKDSITVSAQALRIDDLSGLDLLAYEGERVFIHMDYPELVRNLATVPGGPVGAQIGLMCFALVAGSLMMRGRYRGIMAIAGAVGAGLILPIMGVGGAGAQLVGGVTLVLGLAFAFLWQRMSR